MEALSPTMEEGQIVKWLKSEGDDVQNGDVLAEIETDKATMELTARGSGILRKVLVGEGGTAPVGSVIAVIGEEDEDISAMVEEAGGDGAGAPAEEEDGGEGDEETGDRGDAEDGEEEAADQEEAAQETAEDGTSEEGEDEEESGGGGGEADRSEKPARKGASRTDDARAAGDARVKASPVARRLASEGGVELGGIEGSGPGGRIVKRDVEAALEAAPAEAPGRGRRPSAPVGGEMTEEDYTDVELTQMRKTIARRLTDSLSPIPHFFLTIEVDMGRALAARERINELLEEEGEKVSINDLVIKATAMALRRHPECNAHWKGDFVREFDRVHVGIAVAVEAGLITPIVRDADRKGVGEIGREVRELAARAREKKLQPDEYTGATFSISNLGMFGIHEFTAVINPPEAGILAVGAVEETPVAEDGEVVVRPRMRVTMSCDHRVIDGAQGARFLSTLRAMLEEPGVALL